MRINSRQMFFVYAPIFIVQDGCNFFCISGCCSQLNVFWQLDKNKKVALGSGEVVATGNTLQSVSTCTLPAAQVLQSSKSLLHLRVSFATLAGILISKYPVEISCVAEIVQHYIFCTFWLPSRKKVPPVKGRLWLMPSPYRYTPVNI